MVVRRPDLDREKDQATRARPQNGRQDAHHAPAPHIKAKPSLTSRVEPLRTHAHRLIAHLIRRAPNAAHAAVIPVELRIHATATAQAQADVAGTSAILTANGARAACAHVAAGTAVVAVREQIAAHAVAAREADLALALAGDAELIRRAGGATRAAVVAV